MSFLYSPCPPFFWQTIAVLLLGLDEMDRVYCSPLLVLCNRKATEEACPAPLGTWASLLLVQEGHHTYKDLHYLHTLGMDANIS